jgi:small GTP-binding protein
MADEYDYLFKIAIIGDSGVGKSNLFTRFIRNEFILDSRATIGVEFGSKNVGVHDKVVKAQLWDTAGQEKFKALAKSYYRGCVGCLIVYDITNYESYTHVQKWLNEVRDTADKNLVTLLIGNKSDLEEKRAVQPEEAAEFAEKNNMGFMETSAKQNSNIDSAFVTLVKTIYSTLAGEEEPKEDVILDDEETIEDDKEKDLEKEKQKQKEKPEINPTEDITPNKKHRLSPEKTKKKINNGQGGCQC